MNEQPSAIQLARLLSAGEPHPALDEYERNTTARIAKQLENCPPLSQHAQTLIRTAWAAHRTEQGGVAA